MKTSLSLFLAIATLHSVAQMAVDKPVLLIGAANDRQIGGIGNSSTAEHAVNAATLQAGSYLYATASGTNALTVTTNPLLPAPQPGTNLMVSIANANTGAVTIAVNGAGPYDVLKNGGSAVDPADLLPGMVASLVFDGAAFQLTNARRLERRPCPTGFTQVSELFCIEPVARDTVQLDSASLVCGLLNARICTWGEWYYACSQATNLGMQNMGNQWEWTSSTANGPGTARVVGATSCTHAGAGPAFTIGPRNFRCCYDR